MAIIDNVYFFYTKIASPVAAFVKTNSEFVVDCVVDKKTAKEYAKKFQKQKPKELDNEEFKAKYKVDEVPFPNQEEQYVIKSKKNHIKDGKQTPEKYFPRVLLATEEGNVDITYEKSVGNNSRGKLSYRETTNDFGTFAELSAILVEDLIEYGGGGGGGVTGDFGAVKLAETPENLKVVQKQEEGVIGKSGKKPAPKVEDDEEGLSAPF
jgi:hypothetical protein